MAAPRCHGRSGSCGGHGPASYANFRQARKIVKSAERSRSAYLAQSQKIPMSQTPWVNRDFRGNLPRQSLTVDLAQVLLYGLNMSDTNEFPVVGSRHVVKRSVNPMIWTVRGVTRHGIYVTCPESRSPGNLYSPADFVRFFEAV